MKSTPANHRAAESHETLVDVVTLIEPRAEPSELVQQSDRLLYHVPKNAQAAAVSFAPTGDGRGDVASRQFHAERVGVVGAISHHFLRLAQRRAGFARNRRDRIDQWNQLRH